MGRSGERCQHCGAGVPDDAVYCPACGHPTGHVEVEGVDGGSPGAVTDVSLGPSRRRWVAPAALAAVAAVVVGVFVAGGRGGGTTAPTTTVPATTTPTTTMVPSTSTAPSPTTTTSVYSSTSTGGPLAAGADGVVVYAGIRTDEIVRVDLGAGTVERRLVTRAGGGPWMALGRRGGVVVASARGDQGEVYALTDGPASTPRSIATWEDAGDGGSSSPQVAPAAEPDEVWVWHEGGPNPITVQRLRLDGTVTAGPVTLPKFATMIGADGPGAVLVTGPDGLYRATIDGQSLAIERTWPRVPLIVTPNAFLDLACSSALDCQLGVVDRGTGAVRPVPAGAQDLFNGYYYFASVGSDALSPDGRWLAHLQFTGQSPRLVVYDLVEGRVAVDHEIIGSFYGGIRALPFSFSPDGRLLLFVDGSGQLAVWPVGSPDAPRVVRIPGVDSISSMSVQPAP